MGDDRHITAEDVILYFTHDMEEEALDENWLKHTGLVDEHLAACEKCSVQFGIWMERIAALEAITREKIPQIDTVAEEIGSFGIALGTLYVVAEEFISHIREKWNQDIRMAFNFCRIEDQYEGGVLGAALSASRGMASNSLRHSDGQQYSCGKITICRTESDHTLSFCMNDLEDTNTYQVQVIDALSRTAYTEYSLSRQQPVINVSYSDTDTLIYRVYRSGESAL